MTLAQQVRAVGLRTGFALDLITVEDVRNAERIKASDLAFRKAMVETGGWFHDEPDCKPARRIPVRRVISIRNLTPDAQPITIERETTEQNQAASEKKPLVFNEPIDEIKPPIFTVKGIIEEVCRFYDIPVVDLCSERRPARVVRPRQVAMYLAREMTYASLPRIGRLLGGRDHTTILWGVRKIEKRMQTDERLRDEIELLKLRIKEAVG